MVYADDYHSKWINLIKAFFVVAAAVTPHCLILVPVACLLNDLIYEFSYIIGRSCCPSGNKCEWNILRLPKKRQYKPKTNGEENSFCFSISL